jgi:hypothetical protein
MALEFHRAVEHPEIWSASNAGFSFVISYESPNGPGFRGRGGYVASRHRVQRRDQDWRLPLQDARRSRGSLQQHSEASDEED